MNDRPDLEPTLEVGSGFVAYPDVDPIRLDSHLLGRAICAVLAAADPDLPIVQIEEHKLGVRVVCTDRHSLLWAWVPEPSGDGWEATTSSGPTIPPPLDHEPQSVWAVSDPDGRLAWWATSFAKAKWAKARPKDHVAIVRGYDVDPDGAQTLDPELDKRLTRFAHDDVSVTRGEHDPYDWRQIARSVDQARPVAELGGMAILGGRLQQAGKLGAYAADQNVRVRLVSTAARGQPGGRLLRLDIVGCPVVSGFLLGTD